VVEADEYDTAFFDKRSKFVHYRPTVAILNNLEYDHADIFPDVAAIQRQFHHLVRTCRAAAADRQRRGQASPKCWRWGAGRRWRPSGSMASLSTWTRAADRATTAARSRSCIRGARTSATVQLAAARPPQRDERAGVAGAGECGRRGCGAVLASLATFRSVKRAWK
jgi:UDP-N-acetylmuramate-alanine ligase